MGRLVDHNLGKHEKSAEAKRASVVTITNQLLRPLIVGLK